jgi:hypothetical protein
MQTDKIEIKKIVLEVLDEILAQTQPPDRLALLFYHYINDFNDFKRMVTIKFSEADERFDRIETKLDNCLTKDEFNERAKTFLTKDEFNDRMVDYIAKIGNSVREIVKEAFSDNKRDG